MFLISLAGIGNRDISILLFFFERQELWKPYFSKSVASTLYLAKLIIPLSALRTLMQVRLLENKGFPVVAEKVC